ncbi:MAG: efflux RND transporter periplasmic adaptor subunit [Thermosynechococcaceae cyanobacterium MS004]|nr:efflux RND transporter periplasmic adaptor subunit [Thermosynechococcaceae cyanobacterium MS004]
MNANDPISANISANNISANNSGQNPLPEEEGLLPQSSEQELEVQTLPPPALESSTEQRANSVWLWILAAGVFLGSGILIGRSFTSNDQSVPAVAAQQATPPRPVEVTALRATSASRRVQLSGQVEAQQQSTIRAQTDGVIQQILVQPGDRVFPGQAIAVLDPTDQALALSEAQARLAQQRSNLARLEVGTRREIIAQRQAAVRSAQAREAEAKDNLQRTTELLAEGALSQRLLVEAQTAKADAQGARLRAEAELAEATAGPLQEEIDAQRANVAAAAAAVRQAEVSLRRTQIKASAAGVVQARQASPGDYVESADPLLTLVSSDNLDVFLEIPENLTAQVRPGQTVELSSRALPNWKTQAAITSLIPAADTASRRSRVRVRLTAPPQGLVAGTAIQANLILPTGKASVEVSRDALTRRQNQWLLFTLQGDNTVREYPVEMVADQGQRVAIYHPALRPGQQAVVRGGDALRDGAKVKRVEAPPQQS